MINDKLESEEAANYRHDWPINWPSASCPLAEETMKAKFKCNGLAMFCVLLMAGCSGSANTTTSNSPITTGVFIDGPAIGVKYIFGSYSGLTGVGGTYACQSGQTGQFKLGNIILGQAVCASVITPVDLANYSIPDLAVAQSQAAALPIVKFLMSVGNVADNGTITIPNSVTNLAVNQLTDVLTADSATLLSIAKAVTSNPNLAYVDTSSASNHLLNALANIDQFKHAGEYVSSSWHDDSAAHFLVKPNGDLTGYLLVMYGYVYKIEGSISSSGTLSLNDLFTGQPTPVGVSNGAGILTGTTHASANETFQYMLKRVTPSTTSYYGVFKGALSNANGFPPGECWFAIDTYGKLFGFETGANLGTLTYKLFLKGDINMSTGLISLNSVTGSSDRITISGTIGSDGTVRNGTWQGASASGTFSASKLELQ